MSIRLKHFLSVDLIRKYIRRLPESLNYRKKVREKHFEIEKQVRELNVNRKFLSEKSLVVIIITAG